MFIFYNQCLNLEHSPEIPQKEANDLRTADIYQRWAGFCVVTQVSDQGRPMPKVLLMFLYICRKLYFSMPPSRVVVWVIAGRLKLRRAIIEKTENCMGYRKKLAMLIFFL